MQRPPNCEEALALDLRERSVVAVVPASFVTVRGRQAPALGRSVVALVPALSCGPWSPGSRVQINTMRHSK